MNYPVWDLGAAGGGFLIALIAVVHVYVSHFAVGGGLFLVLTEMKAYREASDDLLDYVKMHSRFFMLLTMVFGSVTGVGIWFTISLLSPGATSTLIHIFVFGFAAEWACFLGEIVALLVYYYRFDKMDRRSHLIVGWLYFLFAWLSLFLINGIIDFMLTPGDWLATGNFWDGFFNPTTWPALFFRTAMAFACTGLFGFLTALHIRGEALRANMVRYCVKWLLAAFTAMPFLAWWYLAALPEGPKAMVLGQSPELAVTVKVFIWLIPLIAAGGLFMALRTPAAVKKPLAFLLLFAGLLYMGAFEWSREAARRPYLIYGHTWSTGVKVTDLPAIEKNGFLKSAKWVRHREITPDNLEAAGEELFRIQCLACHSVKGPMNDIVPLTRGLSVFALEARLTGQGKISSYMPRFLGTDLERRALASYIATGINNESPPSEPDATPPSVNAAPVPAFDMHNAPYVLLAWSRRGMASVSDCDRLWTLGSPANQINAQLIQRGETPEIVTTDIEMRYRPATAGTGPAADPTAMPYDDDQMAYRARTVMPSPLPAQGGFNPYPQYIVEAVQPDGGRVLARTVVTVPLSTELGCKNCHRGPWKTDGVTGISEITARDILVAHDKLSRTDLAAQAADGQPVNCRDCHTDAGREKSTVEGQTAPLNLSAAIHGFHALFLEKKGPAACYACHPSSSGATRDFRGIHREIELDCINCHGTMEDHARGLLAGEKAGGKKEAARLMALLSAESDTKSHSRQPWINEPDCLHCHVDFQEPETDEVPPELKTEEAAALFKNRMDDAGLMCQACHGAAHALFPARNHLAQDLDNIAPRQYQQTPYPVAADRQCRVCHTVDMEDEMHHPNMLTRFRNRW